MGEIKVSWDTFTSIDRIAIAKSYSRQLHIPAARVLELFGIARVEVVLGMEGKSAYCRLTKESKAVVMAIIKNTH